VLTQRRAHRLVAMLEASLWVAGGLVLAGLAHVAGSMPAGHAASAWTVVGGTLLSLGAWVNKACVFGAVARLGSGEWAYAATPVGFFVGRLSVMPLFMRPAASTLADASPLSMD
jgi:toxin CptA